VAGLPPSIMGARRSHLRMARGNADSVWLRAHCYLLHAPQRPHTYSDAHTSPLHVTTLHHTLTPSTRHVSELCKIVAKCTVRVSKLFFQHCTLPHRFFLLFSFFFSPFFLSLFPLLPSKTSKTKNHGASKTKNVKNKKSRGCVPHPPPYGAAPLPPTKVGATSKCLAAVVLAHPDCVLALCSWNISLKATNGLIPTWNAECESPTLALCQ